jgi:hypothetical protein
MRTSVLVDGRNVLDRVEGAEVGFVVCMVGKG